MIYIALLLILIGVLLFVFSVLPATVIVKEAESSPKRASDCPDNDNRNSDDEDSEWPSLGEDLVAIDTVKSPKQLYPEPEEEEAADVSEPEISFADDDIPDIEEIPDISELFLDEDDLSYDDIVSENEDLSPVDDDIPEEIVQEEDVQQEEVAAVDEDVAAEEDYGDEKENDSEIVGAVLFDDFSSLIDYETKTGSIDPTLDDYRNIKRMGEGDFSVTVSGVSFLMKNKLFRYDFHKVDRFYTGDNFIALGIKGMDAGKLFIFSRPGDMIERTGKIYGEFTKENS